MILILVLARHGLSGKVHLCQRVGRLLLLWRFLFLHNNHLKTSISKARKFILIFPYFAVIIFLIGAGRYVLNAFSFYVKI